MAEHVDDASKRTFATVLLLVHDVFLDHELSLAERAPKKRLGMTEEVAEMYADVFSETRLSVETFQSLHGCGERADAQTRRDVVARVSKTDLIKHLSKFKGLEYERYLKDTRAKKRRELQPAEYFGRAFFESTDLSVQDVTKPGA